MTTVRSFHIPGLATVSLDTRDNREPLLEVILEPDYRGDLNDIARHTPGPDNVYLRCDHKSAGKNPELAKFMEVLTHWDYTGDGQPDCDDIIAAIDQALWATDDAPARFRRPYSGWYTKLVMSIMPPQPDRHIVYSFGDLKPRFRWYHHLAALPMLALFFGLVQLQFAVLPFTRYSVISGVIRLVEALGNRWWILLVAVVVYRIVKPKPVRQARSLSSHTYGFFNRASVEEEQGWREGSENWSFFQRLLSCVSFAAIHMTNLIYPLASILPLAVGGGFLTFIYLRTYRRTQSRRAAVLEASIWHRVYNRLALTAIVIVLTLHLGILVFGLVAFGGLILAGKSLWEKYTWQNRLMSLNPVVLSNNPYKQSRR